VRVEGGHIVMPELPGIGFEGKSEPTDPADQTISTVVGSRSGTGPKLLRVTESSVAQIRDLPLLIRGQTRFRIW
jgi:hypothetical protein